MITAAHASSAIQWGDFPTWALAVIALAALIAAVLAYRKQADASTKLADQVSIQRDQLQDQQKANTKQAEVLEAQLREIRQRAEAIERQQADAVTLSPEKWRGELPGYEEGPAPVRMALASNGWHRPIRDVACRLETEFDDTVYEPAATGQITKAIASAVEGPDGRPLEDSVVLDDSGATEIRLLRPGDIAAFIFGVVADVFEEDSLTLRFTDDAGLHWQINSDLHLKKLDNRDDW